MAERKAAPREVVDLLTLGFATRYMRRLIADRDHIREALMNPGGSVILAGVFRTLEGADEYSAQIGNDYHLDLITAELEITNNCPVHTEHPFTELQIDALLFWASRLTDEEASRSGLKTQTPGALRRARHHTVAKVTKRMTDG